MKGIVAVDIGSQYVKLLDVRFDTDKLVVKHAGVKEIFENGERMPDEQITKCIKDLYARMDGASSEARTSLAGKSVVVRNVDFPNISKNEILKHIKEEENKYIPIDLKEYFFDIGILQEASAEKKALKGMIAAARKDAIVNHIKLINNAGLNAVVVDINSLTLINLYETVLAQTGKEDKITAVVDLGASSTHVGILLKNTSIFSREIAVGSMTVTNAICEKLSCDFDSAEKMKHGGMESIGDYASPVVQTLVKELTMSFNFFEGESGRNVERIFFVGGGVLVKGMVDAVAGGLDMPFDIIDPLSVFTVDVKEGPEKLKEIAPQFAVCAGLAVRSM